MFNKWLKPTIVAVFLVVVMPAFIILAGQNTDCSCSFNEPAACSKVACGDGACDSACGEQINYPNMANFCPKDCCSKIAVCGNGVCEKECTETHATCPADCP